MLLTRWCTPCSTALCSSSTTTWLVTVSSVGCLLLGWSRLRCLRGLRAVLRLPSGNLLPRALLREGGAPGCASQPCGGLGALRLRALAFRRRGWPLPLWLAACYLVDADFGVSGDYLLSLKTFRKPSTTSSTTRRCVASCCASPSVVCPVLFGVVLQLYDAVFGHCVVVRCVLLG